MQSLVRALWKFRGTLLRSLERPGARSSLEFLGSFRTIGRAVSESANERGDSAGPESQHHEVAESKLQSSEAPSAKSSGVDVGEPHR
eukprot:15480356-Alexandrium_andersonii.AAC.1